ncbi:DJ-1/PfpI family protein [Treponema rectale]|jgi:DJ-1 family protein|uniref:DJ-1/PfpI family protein n=1 Tax=Treponema rectale TaxID=744512 RepID=A0A7M1XN14_9SPIR|nr:DJ-1/PfpI family protein [Treponema rectale]
MKILMVVTDGFEDIEAVGTLAILRRAQLDVTFAAIDSTHALGRYGVNITDLVNLNKVNFDEYDMLIIPGGPEYIAEENNPEFLKMVMHFASAGKYIAAICAGPTILGHLGLLKGKNYTCFTSMNEDFGGTYVDQYAVVDGKIITGRSAAAVIDFGFAIVETLCGKEYAQKVKNSIYY